MTPQTYQSFLGEQRSSYAGYTVIPNDGEPGRCLLLGLEALPAEPRPFTEPPNHGLRVVLDRLGVPKSLVQLGYVFKADGAGRDPMSIEFVELIRREVRDFLKPRAVVLLGTDAFNAFFSTNFRDVEQLRRTRFYDRSMPESTFFATYSPIEADRADQRGDFGVIREWQADLQNVFEVNERYFAATRQVGG